MPSTPNESPSSAHESLRSPSSQAAFIYPIRSAVSVKPSASKQSSNATAATEASQSRPSLPADSDETPLESLGRTEGTEGNDTFQLHIPQGRAKRAGPPFAGQSEGGDASRRVQNETSSIPADLDNTQSLGNQSATSEDNYAPVDIMRKLRLDSNTESSTHSPRHQIQEVQFPRSQTRGSRSISQTSLGTTDKDLLERMTLPRFRHVETDQGHMVVTGREGEITRCEDEVSRTERQIRVLKSSLPLIDTVFHCLAHPYPRCGSVIRLHDRCARRG